jgi:hypothetical protein
MYPSKLDLKVKWGVVMKICNSDSIAGECETNGMRLKA